MKLVVYGPGKLPVLSLPVSQSLARVGADARDVLVEVRRLHGEVSEEAGSAAESAANAAAEQVREALQEDVDQVAQDRQAIAGLSGSAIVAASTATQRAADAGQSAGAAAARAAEADAARALAEAARLQAEQERLAAQQASVASAFNARYHDTIAAGRAAVADGESFGVRAGGSDGLTRTTIFRRDSATSQVPVAQIVNPAEVDGKASRAELGGKLDAPSGSAAEPSTDEPWAVGDSAGHTALAVEQDGTTRGARFRVADATGATAASLDVDGVSVRRVSVVGPDGVFRAGIGEDGVVSAHQVDAEEVRVDESSRMVTSDDDFWVWRIDDPNGHVGAGLGRDGIFRVRELASTVPIAGGTAPVEPAVTVNARDAAILCVAHRGNSAIAPEETLPAYLTAVRNGYRVLEGDIQFTSDMVPVLIHDSTVDRTSNGSGAVADMTYAQLLELDFGAWKGAAFAGTRIMRVEDMLLFCKRHNCQAQLELKNYTWTQERVQRILDLIRSLGMTKHTNLDSFQSTAVQWVRDLEPTMTVGLLTGGTITSAIIATAAALRTDSNAVYLQAAHSPITAALVKEAHASGLRVGAYTVDAAARALELVDMGIDLIFTNSLNVQALINAREDI